MKYRCARRPRCIVIPHDRDSIRGPFVSLRWDSGDYRRLTNPVPNE
jgi:hypothetical protein